MALNNHVMKSVIAFCTTGHNSETLSLLNDKMSTLPQWMGISIRDHLSSLEYDTQTALGREVRDFIAHRILRLDASADQVGLYDYFTSMEDAVESLKEARPDYPTMAGNSEARRAYLEVFFDVNLSEREEFIPYEDRLITQVQCVDAPPYRKFANDDIAKLIISHPDKWETISSLILSHKIRHAPALEALLDKGVMPSFGSGVL